MASGHHTVPLNPLSHTNALSQAQVDRIPCTFDFAGGVLRQASSSAKALHHSATPQLLDLLSSPLPGEGTAVRKYSAAREGAVAPAKTEAELLTTL